MENLTKMKTNNGEKLSNKETNQEDDHDGVYDLEVIEMAEYAAIDAHHASENEEYAWEEAFKATRRERSDYKAYLKEVLTRKDSEIESFSLELAIREADWCAARKVLHAAKLAWKTAYAECEDAAEAAKHTQAHADFMEKRVKEAREQLTRKNKAGAP